jgi:hypothetical protein
MRRAIRSFRPLLGFFLVWVLCLARPLEARGQIRWQDLVLTSGLSLEDYKGNLPAVTISAVDSTDHASAAVGELGARGRVLLLNSQGRFLDLQFDAGLRQFVAQGFKVRDYAPREWVGRTDLNYRQALTSVGDLWVQAGFGARRVEDRPPMPLFLQPGYATGEGRVRLQFLPVRSMFFDLQLRGELADYSATSLTPQLDLLDRRALGTEAGVTWGPDWRLRFYLGFTGTEYRNQGTFDPGDPYRRDKTWSIGGSWSYTSNFFAQVGLEGTLNRSNSSRPEYDALSFRTVVSAPMPGDLSLSFFAKLTEKWYKTKTDFARLVPGEEADNASTVYLELARPLLVNLDGAVRFGWSRAETDIGNAYFQRYGATFLLRYRPWGR